MKMCRDYKNTCLKLVMCKYKTQCLILIHFEHVNYSLKVYSGILVVAKFHFLVHSSVVTNYDIPILIFHGFFSGQIACF